MVMAPWAPNYQCTTDSQCSLPAEVDAACNSPVCNRTTFQCGVAAVAGPEGVQCDSCRECCTWSLQQWCLPARMCSGFTVPAPTWHRQHMQPGSVQRGWQTAVSRPAGTSASCSLAGSSETGVCSAGSCVLGCNSDSQCRLPPGVDGACNRAVCNVSAAKCAVAAVPNKICTLNSPGSGINLARCD